MNRMPVSTPAGMPSLATTSAIIVVAEDGATVIQRSPVGIGTSRRFSKPSVPT